MSFINNLRGPCINIVWNLFCSNHSVRFLVVFLFLHMYLSFWSVWGGKHGGVVEMLPPQKWVVTLPNLTNLLHSLVEKAVWEQKAEDGKNLYKQNKPFHFIPGLLVETEAGQYLWGCSVAHVVSRANVQRLGAGRESGGTAEPWAFSEFK